MPLQKRLLKFHCAKCRQNEIIDYLKNTITDKENIIQDKNTIIQMLQEKIDNIEKSQISYAAAAAKPISPPPSQIIKNIPAIIIRPITHQPAQTTKYDVQKAINPREISVPINSVNTTNDGKMVIKCATEEATRILTTEIETKLNEKYKIELSKMKKPRIKIIGGNVEMSEIEIEKCLREQNSFIKETDYMKVTFILRTSKGKQIIFAECSGELFSKMMDAKKVFLGWERNPVYEDLMIPRCKRCFAYDHKEANCRNKESCTYCGGEHRINDCPREQKQCCNCIRSVSKYKLTYDTNHEANNRDCPTLKYYTQRFKNSIDYHSK